MERERVEMLDSHARFESWGKKDKTILVYLDVFCSAVEIIARLLKHLEYVKLRSRLMANGWREVKHSRQLRG